MADLTSLTPGTDPSLAALATSGRKVSKASLVDAALAMKDGVLPTLAEGPLSLSRRRGVVTMAKRHRPPSSSYTLPAPRHCCFPGRTCRWCLPILLRRSRPRPAKTGGSWSFRARKCAGQPWHRPGATQTAQ